MRELAYIFIACFLTALLETFGEHNTIFGHRQGLYGFGRKA